MIGHITSNKIQNLDQPSIYVAEEIFKTLKRQLNSYLFQLKKKLIALLKKSN